MINYSEYSIIRKNISKMKKDAIILHPLPRRNEIPAEVEEEADTKD